MTTLNQKSWIFASILYLAMPILLWLAGWVQPYVSLPLTGALFAVLFLIFRRLPQQQVIFSRLPYIASLATIFIITSIIGFTGHFEQNPDFFFRNPIYSSLIRYDWPIVFPDGNLFVYYFGFWLPPALISKFLPVEWSQYVLWLWSLLGMVLCTGTMALYFKGRIWIFTVILFSIAPLTLVMNKVGVMDVFLNPEGLGKDVHWNCMLAQLVCTFNHIIPCLVFGAVFINRVLDKCSLLFLSVLLLFCSPFGGIAFLPYLIVAIFRNCGSLTAFFRSWNIRSTFILATACLFVLLTAMFMSGTGSMDILPLFQKNPGMTLQSWLGIVIFFTVNLGIPAILLYPVFRTSSMYWITVCCFVIFTFVYMGGRYHELIFKTSGIFFFFTAIMCTIALPSLKKTGKRLLIAYISLCSLYPLSLFIHHARSFAVSQTARKQNMRQEWGNSLYHPGEVAYLVKNMNKTGSRIYYSQSGESANGIMAWAATGRHAADPAQYPGKQDDAQETMSRQEP